MNTPTIARKNVFDSSSFLKIISEMLVPLLHWLERSQRNSSL